MPVVVLLHFVNHKASVLSSYWRLVVQLIPDGVEVTHTNSENIVPETVSRQTSEKFQWCTEALQMIYITRRNLSLVNGEEHWGGCGRG